MDREQESFLAARKRPSGRAGARANASALSDPEPGAFPRRCKEVISAATAGGTPGALSSRNAINYEGGLFVDRCSSPALTDTFHRNGRNCGINQRPGSGHPRGPAAPGTMNETRENKKKCSSSRTELIKN